MFSVCHPQVHSMIKMLLRTLDPVISTLSVGSAAAKAAKLTCRLFQNSKCALKCTHWTSTIDRNWFIAFVTSCFQLTNPVIDKGPVRERWFECTKTPFQMVAHADCLVLPVRCCFEHTSSALVWLNLGNFNSTKNVPRLVVYCIVHLSTSSWRSSVTTARNKKKTVREYATVRHNEPFYHRSWSCRDVFTHVYLFFEAKDEYHESPFVAMLPVRSDSELILCRRIVIIKPYAVTSTH